MNTPDQIVRALAAANFSPPGRKKSLSAWLMAGLLLLLALCPARADVPDDDYLAVYGIMNQADTLNASGQTGRAHAKYVEARQALVQFQRSHPDWNVNIVTFRLNYLAEKIADTAAAVVVTHAVGADATLAATPAPQSPVTLLSAGSEPRTVLRLHPDAGDKQTLRTTMKMGMAMSAAGNEMPGMDLPPITMNMDVEVQSVSTNGEITYTIVFDGATAATSTNASPLITAAMSAGLAGMNGLTGTGVMSDRGNVEKMQMNLPATAAPQLGQSLDQMTGSGTPLPEEAVGPGARWEYRTRLKSQGINIDQTVTCELVSVAGDQLTLRNTITQNAANQKIQNPMMPGIKMDLTKMTGAGAGTTTLDLARLMPVSATLDVNSDTVMGMNLGQFQQTMDMKMKMNVTIEAQ